MTSTSHGSLTIPEEGLDEVLRAWNGPGQLLAAVAAVSDDEYAWDWNETDVRRRAHRILFGELEPFLLRWPTRLADWLRALPAESRRRREITVAPVGRVSWHETFVRSGWPPERFVVRTRRRIADELMTTTLRWTIEQLVQVAADAAAVAPGVDVNVKDQLTAATALLSIPPVSEALPQRPSLVDVRALARQGWPWVPVAQVAGSIRSIDASLHEYARRLLMPDESMRPKLFHLAVFGQLLIALRDAGAATTSIRPLSKTTSGPAYRVRIGGADWDLWFEAGGIWSHYKRSSPYVDASASLKGDQRPLSPDILLVRLDEAALVLECKYSANTDYIGGRGLSQALAYAAELKTSICPTVAARVVAPVETLTSTGASIPTVVGSIGVTDPTHLVPGLEEVGIVA